MTFLSPFFALLHTGVGGDWNVAGRRMIDPWVFWQEGSPGEESAIFLKDHHREGKTIKCSSVAVLSLVERRIPRNLFTWKEGEFSI